MIDANFRDGHLLTCEGGSIGCCIRAELLTTALLGAGARDQPLTLCKVTLGGAFDSQRSTLHYLKHYRVAIITIAPYPYGVCPVRNSIASLEISQEEPADQI
jgi:hypothetical protein